MINTNKPLALTQAEIDAIVASDVRKRNVEVFRYPKTPLSNEFDTFYARSLTRQEIQMIVETSNAKGLGAANDLLINLGVLAGPMDLLDLDDALAMGLLKNLGDLLEAKKNS